MIHAAALACALLSRPGPCELPGDADVIMPAIDAATDDDRLRAVLVTYAWHESRWRVHPRAESWDAIEGRARGPWQLWSGGDAPLEAQARTWLDCVQRAGLASVDSSPRRAARRADEARRLLVRAAGR